MVPTRRLSELRGPSDKEEARQEVRTWVSSDGGGSRDKVRTGNWNVWGWGCQSEMARVQADRSFAGSNRAGVERKQEARVQVAA